MLTTLDGKDLAEQMKLLDAQLEDGAYRPVGGGRGQAIGLTDIVPAYLYATLTTIFGVFGVGWGFKVISSSVESSDSGFLGRAVVQPWFAFRDDEKVAHESIMPEVPGASTNNSVEWAEKGAITNALGTAWSFAGWQISVYMGKRSHGKVTPKIQEPSKIIPFQKKTFGKKVTSDTAERMAGFRSEIKSLVGHDKYFEQIVANNNITDLSTVSGDVIDSMAGFITAIKDILAEYKVPSVMKATEEQRVEINNKLLILSTLA